MTHGSQIVYQQTEGGKRIRKGHLLGLQGISSTETDPSTGITTRPVDTAFFYNSVAAFLAVKHFNERRGDVLSGLPGLLGECDFYWTYEFRDTQWSGLEAVRQLAEATGALTASFQDSTARSRGSRKRQGQRQERRDLQGNDISVGNFTTNITSNLTETATVSSEPQKQPPEIQQQPFAMYGAYWSSVSYPLSVLSAGMELPQISGGSTSAALDSGSSMFARTVATNDGDAHAAMLYYKSRGISHVASIFIKDSWGTNYHASLQKYATKYDITFVSFPYDRSGVEQAMADLKQARIFHIFAIMHNWKDVLDVAYRYDMIGRPEYSWIGAEELKWTGSAFSLDRHTEGHLAQALHGIGTINPYFEPSRPFDTALQEMSYNTQLQQAFAQTFAYPEIVMNEDFDWPTSVPTGFTHAIFDAILALGVTACNTSASGLPDLFTGSEFYQALATTTAFDGISGHVAFDPSTGTRVQAGMSYSIDYVVLSDERSTDNAYKFESGLSAVVQGDQIYNHSPFVYFDNTTTVPPSLPPITSMNYNLVSTGAQIVGYVMAGIVLIASFFFLLWTAKCRNLFVVRASQPIFLGQLAIGTLIMALSVFPASLPGASTASSPDPAMDHACMSQLWLVFLGFVTAFSAIFSKTYRLNKLMNSGRGMRRIQVDAQDVMWPFAILMVINVAMLLCVTFISPYHYERVELNSYDRFGRNTETYGTCRPQDNLFYIFLAIAGVSNSGGVFVALHQSWKARNLPTEFSESYYLALSMASLTETLCLGGPILLVVYNNPTAWYVVTSAVLCFGCMTILLPLMLPKYLARHRKARGINVVAQASGAMSRRSNLSISGLDLSVAPGASEMETSQPFDRGSGKMMITRTNHARSKGTSSRSNRQRSSFFFQVANRSKNKNSGMFSMGEGSGKINSGMFSIGEGSGATPTPFGISCPTFDSSARAPMFGGLNMHPVQQSIQQLQAMGASGFDMSDSEEDEKDAE